ncbi:helix-turn-helix domain-containing protein [Clostridium hydrogenum]|uniref:helix-turn-helix domain-containing protein n=1 Tax=Clostridium hydrogenum TaxID=2855764 RepID=UPI001F1BF224|nr:helix-turn-helix domain-containing protein [Clostridium hydrogenum]
MNNIKIHSILNTFYKSTGIKLNFSDTNLNLITCFPEKKTAYNFSVLGMNEISAYLAEAFSKTPIKESSFHTYVLPNNFIFNIAFAIKDNAYMGAFVTEPILIKPFNKKKLETILNSSILSLKDKKNLENTILKLPIIDYSAITPIGNILYELSKTIFQNDIKQILCGSNTKTKIKKPYQMPNNNYNFSILPIEKDNTRFSIFFDITSLIKTGNTELLAKTLHKITAGSLDLYRLYDLEFIRSLKNNFIKLCSIACYIAIDSKAPYEKVINTTDAYICKVENLQNINDIYKLIEEMLLKLTDIVSKSLKGAYSKNIRMTINYIYQHYSEKITLKMLAEHTKLSTFYLSKQIKKETGLSLLDNINKIRIEKSKYLLINTNITILDISQRVGFNYQNHFASIFKKFTGFSPNEFRKALGNELTSKKDYNSFDKTSNALIENISIKLSMLSNLFDSACIIDPVNHKKININTEGNTNCINKICKIERETTYCNNALYIKAYLQNDTIFKLYDKDENTFLMIDIPITSERNTYIVELKKNVSNKFLIDMDEKKVKICLKDSENFLLNKKDIVTGLYCRIYIGKKLDINMRSSILNQKSLFIILFTIENVNQEKNIFNHISINYIFKKFADILSNYLVTPNDWAGRYTGNIFILALNNTNYKNVMSVANKIKKEFNKTTFEIYKNNNFCILNYGIKQYSDKIIDSKHFIKQAFINMNNDKIYFKNLL